MSVKHCAIHRQAELLGKKYVYAAMQQVLDKPKRPRKLRPCEARLDQQMPMAKDWLNRKW